MIRVMYLGGWLACLGVGALSLVGAMVDLARLGARITLQFGGRAAGTDFLNLYTGADLLVHTPRLTYQLATQQLVQQALTGERGALVPFYLPPHAALLFSWLALLPYPIAYVVWLAIGVGCVALSAAWLAPRWAGRWYLLVWLGLSASYLPLLLGLALGQTAALMLLAFAGLSRWLISTPTARWRPAVCLLAWTIKPQLAPWLLLALVLARKWAVLVRLLVIVGTLGVAALAVCGLSGLGDFVQLSAQKLREAFDADPTLLPGPTLLRASQLLLGTGWAAHGAWAVLEGLAGLAFVTLWQHGLAADDGRLLQLAALPILAVISAPYSLVHELTGWLASFWLLWAYTLNRPLARALLLWLTAAVWLAGDSGVVFPGNSGAELVGLLGVCLLGYLVWLMYAHQDSDVCAGLRPVMPSSRSSSGAWSETGTAAGKTP